MAPLFKKKKFIVVNKDKEKEQAEVQQEEVVSTVVCPACKKELIKSQVKENKYVCYECGNYFRVRTSNRIRMVADARSFKKWCTNFSASFKPPSR